MNGPPQSPSTAGSTPWARAAAVFAAASGYLAWLQFRTPLIPGYDGYYHAKFALLFPSIGFVREFKWAAHSIWATQFADKEILFHLFLVPFVRVDPVVGTKVATALLGAAVVTSFWLVLRLNRFRLPLVWTAMLFAAGGPFLYRLTAPRPQLLSMALLLWAVHCIVRRRRAWLFLVTLVYAYSYTAYHLPVAVAALVSAHVLLVDREVDWKTPLAALAGMIAGTLANPYFPNNVELFWVQNFGVPWMALRGGPRLNMAGEFLPMSTREYAVEHLVLLLPVLGAAYLAMIRPLRLSRRTRSLFVVAVAFLVLSWTMRRFVEYSVPTSLLFLAAFYTEHLAGLDPRPSGAGSPGRRPRIVAARVAVAVVIVALGTRSALRLVAEFDSPPPSLREAALFLREHTDPDELVFTCDWDETPALFFYDDRNRYPVVLDPNFMHVRDPEAWQEWNDVANGRYVGRTYDVLARDYRFGVCTWDFEALRTIVEKDPRMEVVHDDGDAWVFRIDRERPTIELDRFLELGRDD